MLLALTMVFSLASTALAKTFSDVPASHWAYAVINDLSDNKILNGYTDGTFKPAATMSNAEFTALITRAYCTLNGLELPGAGTVDQKWYEPAFDEAAANKIITISQFAGKENTPITRSDMALLVSNALADISAPSDVAAALDKFTDASAITSLSASYQGAIAKLGNAGIVNGDSAKRFNAASNMNRAEAATIVSNYLKIAPTLSKVEDGEILLAAAASLKNVFEKGLIPAFNKEYPGIKVTGTFDASGKLQTQIEAGLEADIFFSAGATEMNNLKDGGLIDDASVLNLQENRLVLIGAKGVATKVTGFENITEAKTIAIGDPASVPAGRYAKEAFESLGNWEAVLKKSSLGTNVTEVLTWVAAGSAEVGVVYATDAASNDNVEVLAQVPEGALKLPIVYPIGITSGSKNKPQAEAFIDFLKTDTAKKIFEEYKFTVPN
jgi:molybdate transport system substrate-binding protein